ncbi:MAG: hypothetical protein PHY15_08495 [Eubacteriales bacterium]|nr:hypothetical protein [Eubacteriales bacterium]
MSLPATQPQQQQSLPMELYDPQYRLSSAARDIYIHLWLFYNSNGRFPTRDESLTALSMNKDTFGKHLKTLKASGFILYKQTKTGSRFSSNNYILSCPEISDTKRPVLTVVPCPKKSDKPSDIERNPINNIYNNNINNNIINNSSSSSSSLLEEAAKKMISIYPDYEHGITILLKKARKNNLPDDEEAFLYAIDKLITKIDLSKVLNLSGNWSDSFIKDSFREAKMMLAKSRTNDAQSPAVLKKNYEQIRQENEKEELRRKEYIKINAPEVMSLIAEANSLYSQATKTILTGELNKCNSYKQQANKLVERKNSILLSLGISVDYLDKIYTCIDCRDTGILDDGQVCGCSKN